ncbi:MAG: NAD-dependent succinate-semialdehyde dehydrogenase [Nitrososphaeraceae archaeon]|nr:NAD-dependent succinate-semialdehyde dehydrogenase [Nitrososphaeraceae archaeon]
MLSLKFKTTNPATEEILNEYENMTFEEISNIILNAKRSFPSWKDNYKKRADYLYAFANQFRKNKDNLAKVASQEMGKPVREAMTEIEKCAWTMEYFADNGQVFMTDEIINTDARKSFITFEPLGVIGSIMPWNFPYWQALRFAAPSLIAGNTIVLKPASATMQCGLEIEKIFEKIGLPSGVFRTIVGTSSIAEYLIDSKNVNAVTFTGSVPVGSKVAQRATHQLKKTVLELGGSDPFIVCADANIDKAAAGAVKGRFINCGQSCIASKRFFVVKDVAEKFIDKFVENTEKLRIGNPLDESTDIGPLVNLQGLEFIDQVIHDSLKQGAELLLGGERVDRKGYFYKPTILKNVSPNMPVAEEETFGPVAPITIVENELEAIRFANKSEFGLGCSIWTQDLDKAERLSRLVESGIVTVNNVVVSDPRVPFGGIKNSGFGRELSKYGILEFVNIKSIRFYDNLIRNHHVE